MPSVRSLLPRFLPHRSGRVATRLGALVLELSYAYPFQRPDEDWHFGFQVSPGW